MGFIVGFLVGGVTLLPGLVFLLWWFLPKETLGEDRPVLVLGEIEEQEDLAVRTYKTGWLTVTKEYFDPAFVVPPQKPVTETGEHASAYLSLYRMVRQEETEVIDDGGKVPRPSRKHTYYAVLRHGNLFLYAGEDCAVLQHVIVLADRVVAVWPTGLPDAALFTVQTAICLAKRRRGSSTSSASGPDGAPKGSYFVQCALNVEKEDWYFALIRATKSDKPGDPHGPETRARTRHFATPHMMQLVESLNTTEGQLHTRWLNALMGRLFLAVGSTPQFEQAIRARIEKKLRKINRPGFLDEFQLQHVDVGTATPTITHPKLKHLDPDGRLTVGCWVSYRGEMAIRIATKLTLPIGDVNVVLNVRVVRVEGPVVVLLKPPPSSRLWYAFERMPRLELAIEPVVLLRSVTYSVVTNAIRRKFEAAIRESLVLPAMDDIAFFNTEGEVYRGGIWDNSEDEPESVAESEVAVEAVEPVSPLPVRTVRRPLLRDTTKAALSTTLKKMLLWVAERREPKTEAAWTYTPPEMISSRRGRKGSDAVYLEPTQGVSSATAYAQSAPVDEFAPPLAQFASAQPGLPLLRSDSLNGDAGRPSPPTRRPVPDLPGL